MDEQIKAVLDLIPVLRGQAVTVTPLNGGLTNRNYRVDRGTDCYVLRIAGDNTGLLGIDRKNEWLCCRAAAEAGIGAETIAFVPERGALLTRFLPGRVLQTEDTQHPAVIRRVAEALRRFHDLPPPSGLIEFSPFATIRGYHALARKHAVPFPRNLGPALAIIERIEREARTEEPPCLCHNDLLPSNFIDNGVTLAIVDWEYGGLGDRFFDLGNLAVNHQYNEDQEQTLLAGYFGEARPGELRRLRLMRLTSDMREAMWGFLQAGVSTLPFDYLGYAGKHLERFLTASAAMNMG